jgi:hypothetical protein
LPAGPDDGDPATVVSQSREELEMKKVMLSVPIAALAAAVALVAAPAGIAKDGDILVRGTCTGATTSKLKLSEEDGGIEVEFEVDQNRNGVRWYVTIFQNGTRIARMFRVTHGPSGSFEARIVASSRAGADRFQARATRPGQVCTARATF